MEKPEVEDKAGGTMPTRLGAELGSSSQAEPPQLDRFCKLDLT